MNADDLRRFVWDLNVWKRGGDRAPHKAFTLIAVLERVRAEPSGMGGWPELREPLTVLLDEYGTAKAAAPHYPVWRLTSDSDDIWQVVAEGPLRTTSSGDVYVSDLNQHEAQAGFTPAATMVLRETPGLIDELIRVLLSRTVPPTVWAEIIDVVGGRHLVDALVPIAPPPSSDSGNAVVRTRDPDFRRQVLEAWSGACALCGYDGTHVHDAERALPIALDAAHVRWHAYDGPDTLDNGIALCATDHRLFDRGMLGLGAGGSLRVSPRFSSRSGDPEALLARYGDRSVDLRLLDTEHIDWHISNVFKSA